MLILPFISHFFSPHPPTTLIIGCDVYTESLIDTQHYDLYAYPFAQLYNSIPIRFLFQKKKKIPDSSL